MTSTGNFITLRTRDLPLALPPHHVDAEGFSVFYLNPEKVDWAALCDRAIQQVFPGFKPGFDPRWEALMAKRRKVAKGRRK